MGGKGSGRREVERTVGALPGLGETEADIRAAMAAAWDAVADGRLDPRTCDAMTKAAGVALRAIQQRAQREDLQELRDMLTQAQAVVQAGMAHEIADRLHQADDSDEDPPERN